jgi:excisionase family DNA binding protein
MSSLTVKEAALELGASCDHVRSLVRAGKIHGINIGKGKNQLIRIRREDLDAFIDGAAIVPFPKVKQKKRRSFEPPVKEYV